MDFFTYIKKVVSKFNVSYVDLSKILLGYECVALTSQISQEISSIYKMYV